MNGFGKRLLLGLVLLLALPLVAVAEPGGPGFRGDGAPDGSRLLKRMTRSLDLTADQQRQIKEIFASEQKELATLVERLEEQREAIHKLEQERPLPIEALRKVAREHAEARVDLALAKAKTRDRIDEVLTEEQRAKAKSMMAERHERREDRREERRERQRCDGPKPCGPDCPGPERRGE